MAGKGCLRRWYLTIHKQTLHLLSKLMVSGRIEPMVELLNCSHRTVYTNQTICSDPIETERSEATIPRWREAPNTPGDSMITGGSKRPGTHSAAPWVDWCLCQMDTNSLQLVNLRSFGNDKFYLRGVVVKWSVSTLLLGRPSWIRISARDLPTHSGVSGAADHNCKNMCCNKKILPCYRFDLNVLPLF